MRLGKLGEGIREYQEFYFGTVKFELSHPYGDATDSWNMNLVGSGGLGRIRAEGS